MNKQERKEKVFKEYWKATAPARKEYWKKCKQIDAEEETVCEVCGR